MVVEQGGQLVGFGFPEGEAVVGEGEEVAGLVFGEMSLVDAVVGEVDGGDSSVGDAGVVQACHGVFSFL